MEQPANPWLAKHSAAASRIAWRVRSFRGVDLLTGTLDGDGIGLYFTVK
jgi:hypothetical protein